MEYTEAQSAAMLAAWEEWKERCAVQRCQARNRMMLSKVLTKAFRDKLFAVTDGTVSTIDGKDWDEGKANPFVHEFDVGIIEKAEAPGDNRQTGAEKVKKNYKDATWAAVRESQDPPLKVIHGKLIGPKGIINDIVEHYVERNCPFHWVTVNGRRSLIRSGVSVDEPLRGDGGGESAKTWEELLRDCSTPPELPPGDVAELRRLVWELLSLEECAALLADFRGLTLEHPALLEFLGRTKGASYAARDRARQTLLQCRDLLSGDTQRLALDFMLRQLKERLAAEKRALRLLHALSSEGKYNNLG